MATSWSSSRASSSWWATKRCAGIPECAAIAADASSSACVHAPCIRWRTVPASRYLTRASSSSRRSAAHPSRTSGSTPWRSPAKSRRLRTRRARCRRRSAARSRISSPSSRRTRRSRSATRCSSRSIPLASTSSTARAVRRSASGLILIAAAVLLCTACGGPPGAPSGAAFSRAPETSGLAKQRIYFVMTDRYADGDRSNDRGPGFDATSTAYFHGGDFKGLTANLDRIKAMGFTSIWITPPFGQNTVQGSSAAYHGYWINDFLHVDPQLGTDADFGAFVSRAHALGLKVILDAVVNHTGDTIQLANPAYSTKPYRDCHGQVFDPAKYVGGTSVPCLNEKTMPTPVTLDLKIKQPAWLNDATNYHDRGDLSFSGPCDEQCLEQGDFFGLDDLFTEKPNVVNGLAQIYGDWVRKYKLDGFRVDTARHVNPGFFGIWVPKILAAAHDAGVDDFQIFGEGAVTDPLQLATFVRDRGLPNVLDFPFQDNAVHFTAGQINAAQFAKL